MLNSETKQKINNLRDLLVGKIPNPQGQVQQITLALMYKFMSDIDDSTNELFGNTTFFPGEFAEYKWTYIMDSKLSAQERLNLYAEGLEKMNHNPSVPQLFRHIFKQAFLPFRDPQTLDRFLKQINEFEYEHSEDLGDAFEYLLSSLSAAGDAGQFRTPRHIIDFIVDVVQPSLEDKILDPACGTAGFLVSAYKYLVQHYKDLDMNKISNQIVGYDISPEMVQLALVNLYLHQFPDPKIEEYDTLTSEAKRSEKFDCILANPPFMTPKGGILPHNKFSITSNRSEVLFVDYIMEHLRSTGKAGIIVPEGIIFQSANAYKALRKSLIESGGLWAVVSLPAGVFNPYAGVKTSILLLDKTVKTDQIVFAKVTADGYDLGAQRREISNNDLPTILEEMLTIKSTLKTGQHLELSDNPLIWAVDKSVIADSGDHNLSAERYKTSTSVYQGNWEMVELGEVCEIQNGYAFESSKYSESGYQVMRITNVQKGYIDSKDPKYYPKDEVEGILDSFILKQGDLLISLTGNVGRVGILQNEHIPAVLNQRVAKIAIKDTAQLNEKYLFHLLNDNKFENECIAMSGGVAQKNLSTHSLKLYQIPLPPLEIQEQIVAELDSYQAIIDGAKAIISNRKPKIDIQEDWEMVELGEVVEIFDSRRKPLNKSERKEGIYPYYGATGIVDYVDGYLFEERLLLLGEDGAKRGSGDKTAFIVEGKYWVNNHAHVLKCKEGIIIDLYLMSTLNNMDLNQYITGVTVPKLNQEKMRSIKIPLPSLEIQQAIVAQIEQEQKLVDSAKELIQLYESKIQERVRKVWEG